MFQGIGLYFRENKAVIENIEEYQIIGDFLIFFHTFQSSKCHQKS